MEKGGADRKRSAPPFWIRQKGGGVAVSPPSRPRLGEEEMEAGAETGVAKKTHTTGV